MTNKISAITFAMLLMILIPLSASASSNLIPYTDSHAGFSFQYPDYWIIEKNVNSMLSIQDGTINLIRQEDLTAAEKASYKVMVHVDGSPKYKSNVVFMVTSHRADGGDAYSSSEDAVNAVRLSFEDTMASGTFFLEETYLGDSHAFEYRRTVDVPQWNDKIRITYYIAASKSKAYMMVETILLSQIDDPAYKDQFNQIDQSFRITDNETYKIDPALGWGTFKPGTNGTGPGNPEIGQVEVHENFDSNQFHWPTSDTVKIENGRYELDSRGGFPFTDTNTNLGQISFDFSYQGDATFLDGDESAGYGLVFGYVDKDNYYTFLVNKGGRFMVAREVNGQVVELVPWTESPILQGASHTLMVQGDYMTLNVGGVTNKYAVSFVVDNYEVSRTEINDVLTVKGYMGLFVSKGVYVAFDSLISRNFLLNSIITLDRPVL